MQAAFAAMTKLEAGAIANPDENRMVGHYWLRAPELAPTPAIRGEIEATLARIEAFAAEDERGFQSALVSALAGSRPTLIDARIDASGYRRTLEIVRGAPPSEGRPSGERESRRDG